MTTAPTLADAAIRESMRPKSRRVPARIGQQIAAARKFVLDESSSAFLSDLSHASFIGTPRKMIAVAERVRALARLPHAATWVEYDGHAFRRRTREAYDKVVSYSNAEYDPIAKRTVLHPSLDKPPIEETIPRTGWLMEECGEQLFCVTIVMEYEGTVLVMPTSIAWTTDDSVPPIGRSTDERGASDSRIATGLQGYNIPNVVIGKVPEMYLSSRAATAALTEFMGELRYIWSLLAAINDIPVGIRQVKPSKGFVARGRYRRFVEHSVISILIPKHRDMQKLARQVVAAARRRAHMVRGHWRRDWRHDDQKIWISEHQRGDASLGFVLHDYKVEHEDSKTTA